MIFGKSNIYPLLEEYRFIIGTPYLKIENRKILLDRYINIVILPTTVKHFYCHESS